MFPVTQPVPLTKTTVITLQRECQNSLTSCVQVEKNNLWSSDFNYVTVMYFLGGLRVHKTDCVREIKKLQRKRWRYHVSGRDMDREIETITVFNALSPVFLPFTELWNFAVRWQLLLWLSSVGEQKNPISSIYKAKRQKKKTQEKSPLKSKIINRSIERKEPLRKKSEKERELYRVRQMW